jgi:hypothetical protein
VGIGAVRAALIVAAVLAFFYAMPAASGQPRAHGRELVAQYQLPAETVARYAALATGAARAETASDRTTWADNTMWVGPTQQAGVGRNPYTLVLTVSGVARAAGDIRAQWQAGWEVRESPLATREVLMSVGSVMHGTAAGAPVTLTAISAPLTFRGQRQVAPLLNLVNANNLDISDVHLQVWSGSAPLVVWPALAAPRPALLGAGALCLLLWFFLRRSTARPVAAPPAVVSRLPQVDLQEMLEHPRSADRPKETAPTTAVAAAPAQNQASRVVTALRDVLMKGLAVPTEFDDTRQRRGSSKA